MLHFLVEMRVEQARYDCSGSEFFVLGGIEQTGGGPGGHFRVINESEAYSFATNSWRQIAPIPNSGGNVAAPATSHGQFLYLLGGITNITSPGNEFISDALFRYVGIIIVIIGIMHHHVLLHSLQLRPRKQLVDRAGFHDHSQVRPSDGGG